jgi:hypothetical protein
MFFKVLKHFALQLFVDSFKKVNFSSRHGSWRNTHNQKGWDQKFHEMHGAPSMAKLQNHGLFFRMSNYSAFQQVGRNSPCSHMRISDPL